MATTTPKHHDRGRRDALVPFAVGALVVAILALVVALNAAQDGSAAVEEATDPVTTSVTSTPAERVKSLPDATKDNTDLALEYRDPVTKPVSAGPKTFELVATERKVDVGGKVYELWTFNDMVPGPVMRVVEGDRVTIRIRNEGDSTLVHSVDFHSSRLSGGGGYVQVAPGEEGEFSFVAEYPGVFMYHCATAPILHHIGKGMYGMMIVQPREGFGRPMPEYAFVQSELYASDEDMNRQLPAQTAFNGLPRQYASKPIELPPDQDVRVFFLNAGPSEISSFHVVGTIMDRVFDDGNTDPANLSVGRQTVVLGASGALMAEMRLVGEGEFPFVTHQFGHGEMGAVGMFVTGDGDPVGDGGDEDVEMQH